MPKPSPARANWPILHCMSLLSQGKVRDGYALPGRVRRFLTNSDAISACDFSLNPLIPGKGIALNLLTIFWLQLLEKYGIKHHMLAF